MKRIPVVHLFVNKAHTSHSDPTFSLSKIGHKRPQTTHRYAQTNTHTLLPHPSAQPHLAQCCLWVGSGCWELRVSRSAPDRWQHLRFSSSKSFKLGAKRVIWPQRGESFPCTCLLLLRQLTELLSWRKARQRRGSVWCNQDRGVNCTPGSHVAGHRGIDVSRGKHSLVSLLPLTMYPFSISLSFYYTVFFYCVLCLL